MKSDDYYSMLLIVCATALDIAGKPNDSLMLLVIAMILMIKSWMKKGKSE